MDAAQVLSRLSQAVASGRVAPCYLFSGHPDQTQIIGQQFSELLTQEPLDRLNFSPAGSLYSSEELQRIRDEMSKPSLSGTFKVILIQKVERVPLLLSQTLLKALEEPISSLVVLLFTRQIAFLMPTIISRSVCFSLEGVKEENALPDDCRKRVEALFHDGYDWPAHLLIECAHWLSDRMDRTQLLQCVEFILAKNKYKNHLWSAAITARQLIERSQQSAAALETFLLAAFLFSPNCEKN